jgi:hypothetical protein
MSLRHSCIIQPVTRVPNGAHAEKLAMSLGVSVTGDKQIMIIKSKSLSSLVTFCILRKDRESCLFYNPERR